MLKKMMALSVIAALLLMGFALAEAGSAAVDAEAIERFTDTWVDDGAAVESGSTRMTPRFTVMSCWATGEM